jgi:mitochondrial Rho GTPase 1
VHRGVFSHLCSCVVSLSVEGVGKSSLISTFVSRHFSEVVPGIMTRVRLPPDTENACITTIVDSQGGDAALISALANLTILGSNNNAGVSPSAVGSTTSALFNLQKSLSSSASHANGIENVDSIILVYDLDRDETFFRLENHWLPLIERCYNGEVSNHF